MNKNVIVFIVLIVLGSVGIVGTYVYQSIKESEDYNLTSDASHVKGRIKIGVDNWIGYFPLCSPYMKKLMRGAGYLIECQDDSADYPGRMKKLKKKKLNFAVATIDSFLLNAVDYHFPATIVMVIDESKGGDAIVAHKDKIAKLDDLKTKRDYKVAYTPASPSEHLLRSIAVHFDIPKFKKRGRWSEETDGSSEALEELLDKDVDVAVLWEPDVSRALSNKNIVKILGTEDTQKLIVDILLVEREYSRENPEAVKALMSNYFRTLSYYRKNADSLVEDVEDYTDLSEKKVNAMLKGVKWVNLYDNASIWFGLNPSASGAGEGVIETLQSTSRILVETGAQKEDPIPDSNPYVLQNKSFVESIFNKGLSGGFGGSVVGSSDQSDVEVKKFSKLSEGEWNNLRPVGTFRVRPITFSSGTSRLDDNGKEQIKEAAAALKHYPNFRVMIKGHTGLRGDPNANKELSQNRADAVKDYLTTNLSVDSNRFKAVGYGSSKPLRRNPEESDRAYNYRLPRVELSLVSEVF